MKDKAMKFFGLFITLVLIAGLAGVSAISAGGVSSAATSSLQWTPLSVPDDAHKQLYPGSDVGPMAISPDGITLFAAVNVGGNWSMLKSTDGGYAWRDTGLSDALVANSDSGEVVTAEISPSWSSDGTIYVATTNGVYRSKDRGNTFTALSMSGVSGTIVSLDTGKDADGKVKVVLGTSTEVYLFEDGWAAQGIGSYDVLAVALSPTYASDGIIVAVVNSGTQTIVRTKYGAWGSIDNAVITNNISDRACIGLPSDYDKAAPSLFVGLAASSNNGDVFSIVWGGSSFIPTDLDVSANGSTSSVNIWSMAVSGSFSQAVIVAGAEVAAPTSNNGSILVFASSDGGASWVPADPVNKQPTGETHASVVKTNSVTYVGTCGAQSAVSVALTGGYTSWNQRGLIDTSIGVITDMFVSADYFSDNTMYITTNDSDAASLWITQTGGAQWERIFCSTLTGSPAVCVFDMLRVGTDALVVAQSGTKAIWLSKNEGATFSNKSGPSTIGANLVEVITAFALGSDSSVLYAGGANGVVSQSVDYGVTWTNASSDSEIPDSTTVTDIVLSGNSSLYIGTDGGGVYSANTADFSFLPVGADIPGAAGDVVKVVPDPYEEDYIYAGIAGRAGTKGIWRCYLGDAEAEWEQIADGAAVGNISSLACAEANGILYAISSMDGKGYRCVRPTSTKEEPVFESFSAGLDTGETVKSGLTVISGSNLLFAIGGFGDAYNRIWTASDEIIKMRLLAPANGAMTGDIWANGSYAGKAHVALSWKVVADANLYEVQIASDANFVNVLDSGCFESGSQYTANNVTQANLWLGSKYYWRIRVNTPYMSQWSENWSFTTPLGPKTSLPELLSPASGKTGVILQPVLGWNNSLAATSYELVLAENCNWGNPVLNFVGDKKLGAVTAYQLTFDLKPGTNYCWKVRGLSDVTNSQWSDTGTFTTAATATPIEEKDTGTPAWVWIVIVMSAVLVVGVVVLIIRTRRPI